jgi:2-methylcitrate dehydratase PrpD
MANKTNSNTSLALRLVRHLVEMNINNLPQEATEYCKLLVLDTFGVAFPGSHAPGCQPIIDLMRSWGKGQSSLVIFPNKVSPPFAALANSMMMHAMDFDDTLDESALHTFVSVLPAAMAASEYIGGVDGKRLIEALVAGVEIICRISRGIRRPLSWIRTATCGTFGAATAVGKLLNLNEEQMLNALGIAYAQTSGNAQGLLEGRLVKRLQPAFASQAGLNSAFFAKAGITGSHDFLEGPYGFYNLYELGDYDPKPVLHNLASHLSILDLSIKPYPCCRMTHSSIDAIKSLRLKVHEKIDEIEAISVKASKMVTEMVGKPFVIGTDPQVDAQFSIPYTIGTMLLRGDVFLEDFEESKILDERRLKLARLVRVAIDGNLPNKDIFVSNVAIRMKNGEEYATIVDRPLGNPSNPIGSQRCHEKFMKCITYSGLESGMEETEKLIDSIDRLEHLRDVKQLMELSQI